MTKILGTLTFENTPNWRDPKWVQLSVIGSYAIFARIYFHSETTLTTYFTNLLLACAVDIFFGIVVYRVIRFPVAALIIGTASTILLDTPHTFVYILTVILGISSKAFIKYKGQHLFNPANFGVVAALLLLGPYATGAGTLFSGNWVPSLVFLVLGLFTLIYAKRLPVALGWWGGFLIFALVRWLVLKGNPFIIFGVMLSPPFLLFSAHMISDPKTTPKTTKFQLLFGFAIATVDAILKIYEIPYGNFYALVIVAAFIPFIWDKEKSCA